MTQQERIDLIKALTEVVKANNGFWGDESLVNDANNKIQQLIKQLDQ